MPAEVFDAARPVLNGRADQLADAILSLERFDRVEKARSSGGTRTSRLQLARASTSV